MSAPANSHLFNAHLTWTGAAKGPTATPDFSRDMKVSIEGKPDIAGSSAPGFRGDPKAHNPEDLLLSALSMCHALTYLAVCAGSGVQVLAYEDHAEGVLEKVERTFRFTGATLRPRVVVAAGSNLDRANSLHDKAHANCFIANSINFPVKIEAEVTIRE